MSYLVRVQLPDSPGSLGYLAHALGDIEANIQSVDIVENFPDGTVMDDIVVDLPQSTMADEIITAAQGVDGVEIDSIRPFSGRVDRRGQIHLLARVAARTSVKAAMQEVCAAIPKALTSNWAIITTNISPIKRIAASDAAPADDGTNPTELGITEARILNKDRDTWIPESWTLLDSSLAAAPLVGTNYVVVMGRVGGPDYLASEVQHLGDLGAILGKFLT
ncbi:amino acid-binding ACT domain protein [Corynebacterium sp.]|uniref:amino acid-binding ACT domain protein n=1 Tax=unclassified Corynebacterium TaxID=2624378 RepID=UPI0025F8AAD8|nr:amino acid-binding ACT domain protein [Corynebacterium sp.]